MKLLILGGTRFLGRHLAEQALADGDEVTLLHRGRSSSTLFPEAEHLIADRDADLSILTGRRFGAVVDTSAYRPMQVRAAAAALDLQTHYVLISSISVYADACTPADEDAALATTDEPEAATVTGHNYGALKALCEAEAQRLWPGRCLIVRPGLIVGPHDPSGRFTWWVRRIAAGGTVLAPGDPQAPVQIIDARDLAAWLLRLARRGDTGVFNATGPTQGLLTMGQMLQTTTQVLSPSAQLRWMDEARLLAEGVSPWSDLPVWTGPDASGLHRTSIDRAVALGLHTRPLADTVRDTWAWAQQQPAAPTPPGLSAEREAGLLRLLQA